MRNVYLMLISLAFSVTVHSETYQFHGNYYDYAETKTCRSLPAVATLIISNGESTVTIDAPGARCPPPQIINGGAILRTSLFPFYTIYFTAEHNCRGTKIRQAAMGFGLDQNGYISSPIIFEREGRWKTTLFETEQHTVFKPCSN